MSMSPETRKILSNIEKDLRATRWGDRLERYKSACRMAFSVSEDSKLRQITNRIMADIELEYPNQHGIFQQIFEEELAKWAEQQTTILMETTK